MRALFVHNIKIKKDTNGNLYTHSSYNSKVWERYLKVFENLSVITRKETNVYSEAYAREHFEYFDSNIIKNIETTNIHDSILSYINPKIRNENRNIIKNAVMTHDYIIARLPSYLGYLAIEYAKKFNKPYLIEVVACSWDGLWNHGLKGKLLALPSYIKQKKVIKESPYVVYVTNEFLQKRYPTMGKHTNCSNVLLKDIGDVVIEKRLNKIESIKESSKIIIGTTAAVDVKYKGQQYVIQALGKLKKEGIINFEYQLVGGGNQTYLKSIAEKYDVLSQVKFLGSMPHDDVFKWLDTIDIYVQPSRQEGLPRALIEAMSRGLPAFGARTAGIPELLDSKYVFSNTRRNVSEICEILKSFNKKIMKEQARRNYIESQKYYASIIENRRYSFFKDFRDAYKLNKDCD